jgi:hypothetical protein
MKRNLIATTIIALTLTLSVAVTSFAGETFDLAKPYASMYFTQKFYAGERVDIGVIGDGGTNLDLYVLDAYGKELARRVGPTDIEALTLDIFRTEVFTIKVVNRGPYTNQFMVFTDLR